MKTLKGKVTGIIIVSFAIFISLSVFVSYIFYSNAINTSTVLDVSSSQTQFFVIYTCGELIIAVLMLVLIINLFDFMVIKPIKRISDAVSEVKYDGGESEPGTIDDAKESKDSLKELYVSSNDELETLCNCIKKMHADANDYIDGIHELDWDSEHDSMTLLYNRKKYEKRKKSVYPYVDKIYIACLDIINLSVVNTRLSVEAGDSIISKVGRELRRISSDNIHCYRMEDDNFIIVFLGFKEDEAVKMINQWNERVGRLNRVTDNFDCSIVWGGSYGENDINVDDIYKRADAEMYCQKMIAKKELGGIN